MANSVMQRFACGMLLCMVVTAPYAAEGAISCGLVASKLAPCLNYLRMGGAIPPLCCAGVKALHAAAQTTLDRQTACGCLKNTAAGMSGLNSTFASSLPAGKCCVNIPYKISLSTDCSKLK